MIGIDKNHEIKTLYRSPVKIGVLSAIVLGFAATLGWIALERYTHRASAPLDSAFYWIAGLSAFAVLLFLVRVLPMWLKLGQPVLTLSKDGITVTGQPIIPWGEVVANDWHSLSAVFVTVGATLVIKTATREVKYDVLTLDCSRKTYFALCNMYGRR